MEVHTPKKPPRSWGELAREIGIIVIGVLIALSAEQSVQWLHRYSTRRQLEEDLREEMRLNDPYLQEDIKTAYADYDWAARESAAIQAAVQNNAIATLKIDRYPGLDFVIPRQSVWQHARESGTLALLPRDEAQAYTALYRVHDVLSDRVTKWFDASRQQEAIGIRLGSRRSLTDLSRLPPAQLEQLSAVLAEEAAAARWVLTSLGRISSFQAVLQSGNWSQEEMLKAGSDSRNPVRQLMQSESPAPPGQEKTN